MKLVVSRVYNLLEDIQMAEILSDETIAEKVPSMEKISKELSLHEINTCAISDVNDPYFKSVEKRILRKFDFIVIPCLSLSYLYSNLDKSNIGNAQAAGMGEDLGLVGNQYGNVISLLFVTYVLFETPAALLLKRIGLKYSFSVLTLLFGILSLCTAFVNSYHSLLACRMVLGLCESGIIPIISVYLGMLYTKKEMAKRCSAIYCSSALAGAFGGLLAYGLLRIETNNWAGWRWLFAIEGALTILSFPILVLLLPSQPETVWWLTTEEKRILIIRFQLYPDFYQDEKFTWSEVKRSLLDPFNVLICLYEFCADLTLFGMSTFLPSLIKGMGYNKYITQLLTIPYYSIALISFIIIGYISDKIQHRGGFILVCLIIEIIGYAILIGSDILGVRYFGCMLIGFGMYVCSALSIMWANNNNAGYYKRATIGGMITTIGSLSGVLAGQVYTAETAPRFFKGLKVAMALTCVGFGLIVCIIIILHRRNAKNSKKLDELKEQGVDIDDLENPKDDRAVNFKFLL